MSTTNQRKSLPEHSLLAENPHLVEEWDYEKNNLIGIFPDQVLPYSNKKVWWKCSACGHQWEAKINNRANGRSCPKCAQELRNSKKRKANKGIDDLATLFPEIAETWNFEKNTLYLPSDLKPYSEVSVWWKCDRGHEWKSTVHNRVTNSGCPICSKGRKSSLPEQALFFYLSKLFIAENRIKVNGWEIDVFLPDYNIGIEYDGWLYHSSERQKEREEKKNSALKEAGIYLIRVKENKDYDRIIGNTVYYIIESNYKHLGFALESVVSLISKIIEKTLFVDINFNRDRLEILNAFYTYEKAHSLAKEHPDVATEWNYSKNGELKPDMVSSGSGESVRWVCPQGHSYKTTVYSRVGLRHGCPFCSGKKVLKGFNDLETVNPTLAKEWNYEKNKQVLPSSVTSNSGKKVWWICSNNHEYPATIASRNSGTGCPYCAGKRLLSGYNDLASLFPELIKEWNYKKNGSLSPDAITAFNEKRVWWICPKGHEYEASVGARTSRNHGCPYCSGQRVLAGFNDLNSLFPQLAKEWDYNKNDILPTDITYGSGKKVWWYCPSCGNEYQSAVYERTKGCGCPKCAAKQRWITRTSRQRGIITQSTKILLIEKKPELLEEWDYQNNSPLNLDPETIDAYSTIKAWWKCKCCNNLWQATIKNRCCGAGCPVCGQRKANENRKKAKFSDSLAARYPALIDEWDYQKNGDLDPNSIHFGSETKVGWICKKCGNRWDARISNRIHGKGCPFCAHLIISSGNNDLKTLFPSLAEEFDESKNGISAASVFPKSNKKYWWLCKKGHSYEATAASRTNCNSGCPYCSGRMALPGVNDLETLYPDLAKEWDYEKNGARLPKNILPGSGVKIWWKCDKGHAWQAAPYSRIKGSGCPLCRNKKQVN